MNIFNKISTTLAFVSAIFGLLFFLGFFVAKGDVGVTSFIYSTFYLLFGIPVVAILLTVIPPEPQKQVKNSWIAIVCNLPLVLYSAKGVAGVYVFLPFLFFIVPLSVAYIRKHHQTKI